MTEKATWCSLGKHLSSEMRPLAGRTWCQPCIKDYYTSYRNIPEHRAAKNKQSREAHARTRAEVLAHYGIGGIPMCHCCKERIIEFLGIDHIEGGGRQHRVSIGRSIYEWLKKHNFPEGFRDLCHNCNQSLGAYGYCPHEKSNV